MKDYVQFQYKMRGVTGSIRKKPRKEAEALVKLGRGFIIDAAPAPAPEETPAPAPKTRARKTPAKPAKAAAELM